MAHTFHECHRSSQVWDWVLGKWGEATGETKVRSTDGVEVIFGDRSLTWLDESEQAEWAGLEEPFAVVHKTTQHVLLQERNRDAVPPQTSVCQKIQDVVNRLPGCRQRQPGTCSVTLAPGLECPVSQEQLALQCPVLASATAPASTPAPQRPSVSPLGLSRTLRRSREFEGFEGVKWLRFNLIRQLKLVLACSCLWQLDQVYFRRFWVI